jgi:hypothetical protein
MDCPNVHFYIHGRESKDTFRIVMGALGRIARTLGDQDDEGNRARRGNYLRLSEFDNADEIHAIWAEGHAMPRDIETRLKDRFGDDWRRPVRLHGIQALLAAMVRLEKGWRHYVTVDGRDNRRDPTYTDLQVCDLLQRFHFCPIKVVSRNDTYDDVTEEGPCFLPDDWAGNFKSGAKTAWHLLTRGAQVTQFFAASLVTKAARMFRSNKLDGWYKRLCDRATHRINPVQRHMYSRLVFHDSAYNLSRRDWVNWFLATGAEDAVVFGFYPLELLTTDIMPSHYYYTEYNKWNVPLGCFKQSVVTFENGMSGYAHSKDTWSLLMKHPVLNGTVSMTVESAMAAGPMRVFHVQRAHGGSEPKPRRFVVPQHRRCVKVMDIWRMYDSYIDDFAPRQYIKVAANEWDAIISSMASRNLRDNKVEHIMSFIRQRYQGASVGASVHGRAWTLSPEDFRSVCIAAMVLREENELTSQAAEFRLKHPKAGCIRRWFVRHMRGKRSIYHKFAVMIGRRDEKFRDMLEQRPENQFYQQETVNRILNPLARLYNRGDGDVVVQMPHFEPVLEEDFESEQPACEMVPLHFPANMAPHMPLPQVPKPSAPKAPIEFAADGSAIPPRDEGFEDPGMGPYERDMKQLQVSKEKEYAESESDATIYREAEPAPAQMSIPELVIKSFDSDEMFAALKDMEPGIVVTRPAPKGEIPRARSMAAFQQFAPGFSACTEVFDYFAGSGREGVALARATGGFYSGSEVSEARRTSDVVNSYAASGKVKFWHNEWSDLAKEFLRLTPGNPLSDASVPVEHRNVLHYFDAPWIGVDKGGLGPDVGISADRELWRAYVEYLIAKYQVVVLKVSPNFELDFGGNPKIVNFYANARRDTTPFVKFAVYNYNGDMHDVVLADRSREVPCSMCADIAEVGGAQEASCDHGSAATQVDFALSEDDLQRWLMDLLRDIDRTTGGLQHTNQQVKEVVKTLHPFSVKTQVEYIRGPPGCSKTYITAGLLRKNGWRSTDGVVTPTNYLMGDYIKALVGGLRGIKPVVRTFQHALTRGIVAAGGDLFVDEMTMIDYRYLAAIVNLQRPRRVFLVGDTKQTGVRPLKPDGTGEGIPIKDRIGLETGRVRTHTMHVNFRNYPCVVHVLNELFGYKMRAFRTCPKHKHGFEFHSLSDTKTLEAIKSAPGFDEKSLLFAATRRTALKYCGDVSDEDKDVSEVRPSTIRTKQGMTCDIGLMFHTKTDNQLFNSMTSMQIVALSRHREILHIFTDQTGNENALVRLQQRMRQLVQDAHGFVQHANLVDMPHAIDVLEGLAPKDTGNQSKLVRSVPSQARSSTSSRQTTSPTTGRSTRPSYPRRRRGGKAASTTRNTNGRSTNRGSRKGSSLNKAKSLRGRSTQLSLLTDLASIMA